ncbi:MAG: hypothetical protein NTX50_24315 [Candidatus Sumerlaeota bacterium]|nr:hypothetical protein [Candidatus Sumerlaeota bacterium]
MKTRGDRHDGSQSKPHRAHFTFYILPRAGIAITAGDNSMMQI